MVEFLKKKWVEYSILLTITVIGCIVTNHFTSRENRKNSIDRVLEQKAGLDYVNQQDNAIRSYVDTQDRNILNTIKQHADESAKSNEAQLELFKSMDKKLNILISKTK